jgi:hypothetical protein
VTRCVNLKTALAATTAVAAAGLMSAPSHAMFPALTIDVDVNNGAFTETWTPGATDLGGGDIRYTVGQAIPGVLTMTGLVDARPDPTHENGLYLGPDLNFTNETDQNMDLIITITLPVSSFDVPGNWGSISTWNLGGPLGSDPTLMTLPGDSLWKLFVDDTEVGSLYDDPSGMGGGTLSLFTSPIFGTSDPITDDISIRMAFSITPGATGGVNGAFGFNQIPAPGALALLGAAGLFARRRRR